MKETLSIVVPVMNEEGSIRLLVDQIRKAISNLDQIQSYEIIFVDDGSTDSTAQVIMSLLQGDYYIKLIRFRKNFGKSSALGAGFRHSIGSLIVTIDGDLQDDPAELPKLVEKIREGYDLVSGWKKKRNDPLEKVVPSKIFNYFVSKVTSLKLHDFNCGYKIYRRWCIEKLYLTGNLYRFLPVFVAQQGGKIAEVPIHHRGRQHGVSKFGIKRYFHGLIDLFTVILITQFLTKPTYFFALFAVPLLLSGLTLGAYLFLGHLYWLISGDIAYQLISRPLLVISIGLFGFGVNIFLVGLLAEFFLFISSALDKNLNQASILEMKNFSDEN